MDATIIDAPKSTKNAEQERDPEMHQTKKGNVWYFGGKYHVGVDAGSGPVHTVITTAANVHDATPAPKLLREDDDVAYGDSAYSALENHDEIKNNPSLSKIDFRVNKMKPYRKNCWIEGPKTYWLCQLEYQKSRVRSKVEYVFHIVKDIGVSSGVFLKLIEFDKFEIGIMLGFPQSEEFYDITPAQPVVDGDRRLDAPVFGDICQGDVFVLEIGRINTDIDPAGVDGVLFDRFCHMVHFQDSDNTRLPDDRRAGL